MARQFTSVTCVLAETQRQAAEGEVHRGVPCWPGGAGGRLARSRHPT